MADGGFTNAVKTLAAGGAALNAAQLQLFETSASDPYGQNANITFPSNLIQNDRNFYISFRFEKYEKPKTASGQKVEVVPLAGIKLPLPNQLRDDKSVTYDSANFGPFVGAVFDNLVNKDKVKAGIESLRGVGVDTLKSMTSAAWEKFKSGVATAVDNPSAAADKTIEAFNATRSNAMVVGAGVEALQSRFPDLANYISSYSGTSFNPYQAILFKTPNFRKHSFSWRLTPSNQQESDKIRTIIDLFQGNMLPDVAFNNVLFRYPSVVNVNLFPDDYYLYKFKKCVIESVSVNYAPHNSPSFYRTNAPAAVDFTVNLNEIELWTRVDYTGPAPKPAIAGSKVTAPESDFTTPRPNLGTPPT